MKSKLMIAVIAALLLTAPVWGQCNSGTGLLNKLCSPSVNPKPLALTTNFTDTGHPETMSPGIDSKAFDRMDTLRTENGRYLLAAGFFEAYLECFSLDSGNPGAGGYYPAPLKGNRAEMITHLLKRAETYPEISHDAIQELLFAIVQGTDLQKMSPQAQQAGMALLTKEQLAQLRSSGGGKRAMDWVRGQIARNAKAQGVLNNAQNKVNQEDQQYGVSDTVGSLQGAPTASPQASAPPIPRGTWIRMQEGFYLRYLPDGPGKIRVQILVSARATEFQMLAKETFDPTDYIALSGGSPAMRLGISSRPADKRE